MRRTKPITGPGGKVAIKAKTATQPARFTSTIYTGTKLSIAGYDLPVVIDLAGLTPNPVMVANLDHKASRRVASFDDLRNDGRTLVASGTINATTKWAREVVQSAKRGYKWQSSVEVQPTHIETLKAGAAANVNGRDFRGPLYITRLGVLKGFAFVSHGADSATTVNVAAKAGKYPLADMVATQTIERRMMAAGVMSPLMLEFVTGTSGLELTNILEAQGVEPAYKLGGVNHYPVMSALQALMHHERNTDDEID